MEYINGIAADFGFFKTIGITIGPNNAGNILSKAGATAGFVNNGVTIGAKNNIPVNRIAVVTNADVATAMIDIIRPFSLPGSQSNNLIAFKAAGSFIFWTLPVVEAKYIAPGPIIGGAIDNFSANPVIARAIASGAAIVNVCIILISKLKYRVIPRGTAKKNIQIISVVDTPNLWTLSLNSCDFDIVFFPSSINLQLY